MNKIKVNEIIARAPERLKKLFPYARLIGFICLPLLLLGLAIAVLAAGGAKEAGEIDAEVGSESAADLYSDEAIPNCLEYQSLGNGTCIVMGLGSFEGNELYIPDTSPFGDTVIGIGNGAFEDCRALVSVSIPKTVSSIGIGAFLNCDSLVLISVDSSNQHYRSHSGVLYSKDKSVLICCPASRIGSSFLLDASVRVIEANAFLGNKNIEKILYENSTADFEGITVGEGNENFLALPITCNYRNAK